VEEITQYLFIPGSGNYTSVEEINQNSRENFLLGTHPNPFQLQAHIKYSLSKESRVTLRIFNSIGNEVGSLDGYVKPPGIHEFIWTPHNLSDGLYFVQISFGGDIQTGKVLHINQY